jgi:hypothetical protein
VQAADFGYLDYLALAAGPYSSCVRGVFA